MTRSNMSAGFDPRIADWLEDDPNDAPDAVLNTVLAAFPSIPQRRAVRGSWRSFRMTRPALLGAAAAVALLIGGSLLVLRPATGPAASPSPLATVVPSAHPSAPSAAVGPLSQAFSSSHYGYTIQIPADWTASPAVQRWAWGTETLWGDPALDVLQGARARLVIASQPLGPGQADNDWYRAYCQLGAPTGTDCQLYIEKGPVIRIGSAQGLIHLDGVRAAGGTILPGGPIFDAVVVTNHRGYEFTLDGDVDRATFERLMTSVTFSPVASRIDHLSRPYVSVAYGFGMKIDPSWNVTPTTKKRTDPLSAETFADTIHVTGTDTAITASAAPLGHRTWAELLARLRANTTGTVPSECEGGDPSRWPTTPVGDQRGRIQQLCNAAIVYVLSGGTVFEFDWGNSTFYTPQHLDEVDFLDVLTGVTFP